MPDHITCNGIADHLYSTNVSEEIASLPEEKKNEWFKNTLVEPTEEFTQEQSEVMNDVWLPKEPQQ